MYSTHGPYEEGVENLLAVMTQIEVFLTVHIALLGILEGSSLDLADAHALGVSTLGGGVVDDVKAGTSENSSMRNSQGTLELSPPPPFGHCPIKIAVENIGRSCMRVQTQPFAPAARPFSRGAPSCVSSWAASSSRWRCARSVPRSRGLSLFGEPLPGIGADSH